MSSLGIYLYYPPGAAIGAEGLGRLLLFILNGMLKRNEKLIIACPQWVVPELNKLLNDFPNHQNQIEVIYPTGLSVAVTLGNMFKKHKKKAHRPIDRNGKIKAYLHTFKFNFFSWLTRAIYIAVRKKEIARLNALVNARKDVGSWLITNLFSPEAKGVNAQKVVVAPDLVYLDFPVEFSNTSLKWHHFCYEKSAKMADKLICYSRYVKEKHLVEGCGIAPSRITIIPHGWIDLSRYLKSDTETSLEVAKKILREWLQQNKERLPTGLLDFDLINADFFFYSSQARPHKNLFNLVKAYEYLLRRKGIHSKLVLTCHIDDNALASYILEKQLSAEIICLQKVPNPVLAALNKLSVCAVNPTYFEGGFPFTFSEAYSVGTPSVMSDIPVTRERVTDKEIAKRMLFNPSDYQDMAEKMAWAFQHPELLLDIERPLADQLSQRTWDLVADEYISLLK